MTTRRTRAGVTLLELLVSMLLLLVVIAIGAVTSQRTLTVQSRLGVLTARRDGISDALRTIGRHAAGVDPAAGELLAARDSLLELRHTIGVATVCRSGGDTLILEHGPDSVAWAGTLPRAVTADDELRLWDDGVGRWAGRRILTIGSASGACGDSTTPWPGRAAFRVVVDSFVGAIRPGGLVRVLQRERWSLVRSGDGRWSLSLATWDAARRAYDPSQPLLAPLASPIAPGGQGFTVRAIDRAGVVLIDSIALRRTRSLLATLRTAAHSRLGTTVDSIRVNVGAH